MLIRLHAPDGGGRSFLSHYESCASLLSGDHFPLEARHHLAPWLDQNFSTDLDLANPQHEEHAQRLVMELVAQLESKERPPLAATKLNDTTLLGRKFSE